VIYLYCPECGKKGVTLHIRAVDDYYGCRYCNFEFYTHGTDRFDRQARAALAVRNPGFKV